MRVLVDSTVWIDFFRAFDAPHTRRLKSLLATGEGVCICGHVFAEVLRGTRHDEQYRKVKRHFEAMEYLPMDQQSFKKAADIYRHLRRNGITLKNTVDTFIAAVALEHGVYLLHNDSDFDLVASAVFPQDCSATKHNLDRTSGWIPTRYRADTLRKFTCFDERYLVFIILNHQWYLVGHPRR